MSNDKSSKYIQNQINFCIQPWFVEYSRPFVISEDRLWERGSLPATLYILTRVFSMANDKSLKFTQNQLLFCIQPWIIEFSRPIVFGEDRLRERGSLRAIFYVLKGYIPVSYTHLVLKTSCFTWCSVKGKG